MKVLTDSGLTTFWNKIKSYVTGNVYNPDNEDISSYTSSGSKILRLADRTYNASNFSGKGYKILRKNIQKVSLAVVNISVNTAPSSDGYVSFIINGIETHVDLVASTDNTIDLVAQKIATKLSDTMTEYEVSQSASSVTLTRKFGGAVSASSSFSSNSTGASCTISDSTKSEHRNIITAIMTNSPNTIYEIRYDFDLNGETIEIPVGCTLKFEGGSLKNGTVRGNNTNIVAEICKIFSTDLKLNSSFSNICIYPEWYGAIPNGIADNTIAIQRAFDSPIQKINFSKGVYLISSPIEIGIGKNIEGVNGGIFGGGATTIRNNSKGSGIFYFTNNSSHGQVDGSRIGNFRLIADNPIKFNDENTAKIYDGGNTNVPYVMRPHVFNCSIEPVSSDGKTIGISFSKCFDGMIELCDIHSFHTGILFRGTDISTIENNRIFGCKKYLICTLSCSTFGSQTLIEHNDLLAIADGGTMIKTTDAHVRIYDNYLESYNNLESFIDFSMNEVPEYAGQKSASNRTIYVSGNRIDGISCAKHAYKINNKGVKIYLEDSNTTGYFGVSYAIYDANGEETDHFEFFFNPFIKLELEIKGFVFGIWNSFKTNKTIGEITAESMSFLNLYNNNSYKYYYPIGKEIYFKPDSSINISDMDNSLLGILPNETYSIEITFRAIEDTTLKLCVLDEKEAGFNYKDIELKEGVNNVQFVCGSNVGYKGFFLYTKKAFFIKRISSRVIPTKYICSLEEKIQNGWYFPKIALEYGKYYVLKWDDENLKQVTYWITATNYKYIKNNEPFTVSELLVNRFDCKTGSNIKLYELLFDNSSSVSYDNSTSDIDIKKHGLHLTFDNEVIFVNKGVKYKLESHKIDYKVKGSTNDRPSLSTSDDGFEYYDSTLKKKILWNGSAWVNMDGTILV